MGIIRVTVFQRSLLEGLNLNTVKKLSAVKSNFLIFPEFFYTDDSVRDYAKLEDKSNFALEWLCKLNETYRGIIIGGSMIYSENGSKYIATPIISGGEVIDWYKKRKLSKEESAIAVSGQDCGEYILGGNRFSIITGDEIKDPSFIKEIADRKIHFVIVISNSYSENPETIESDQATYCKPAAEYGIHFVKCSPCGSFMGRELQGRSLAVSPSGISWRVSQNEENGELIKTVIVNL